MSWRHLVGEIGALLAAPQHDAPHRAAGGTLDAGQQLCASEE
jgi:hypothetical protein